VRFLNTQKLCSPFLMGEGTWQVEIYSHEIFFFQTLKAKTTRRKKIFSILIYQNSKPFNAF